MVSPDSLFKAHLAHVRQIYTEALAKTPFEAIVIGAGFAHRKFLDDMYDPFTPSPHFKYWVPLSQAPGSMVIHVPGNRPKLLFLQPEDYWHKPPETPTDAWVSEFDLIPIRTFTQARDHIPPHAVFIGDTFIGQDTFGFKAANPPTFLAHVHYARARKTPYEMACLRIATQIGANGHKAALEGFKSGISEFATHLKYLEATGHMEAELPYHNIIAHNDAAAILHYTELRRQSPQPLSTLLIDAGGQYRGYASDITRTHTTDTGVFGQLKQHMDALEQRLCAMVTPGTDYVSIHLAAHREIAQTLAELNIISLSVDAAVDTGLTSTFFPHGIGHLLGLQVHDIGGHQTHPDGQVTMPPAGHPFLRLTRVLEEDVVVTIEPGIYFIPMLLKQAHEKGLSKHINQALVEQLLPFGGVRIEDNVCASATGAINLTREVLPF